MRPPSAGLEVDGASPLCSKRIMNSVASWVFWLSVFPGQAGPVSDGVIEQAERLRDAALADDTAYRYLEALTTEIGPRLAGTEDEARARRWTVKALQRLGFKKSQIRLEPFEMETWVRGEEKARLVAPFPQPLVVTALGRSGSTGAKGLELPLVVFDTIEDLEAVKEGALAGKVAYVSHRMGKTQDGSSYSYFGKARFSGPAIAAKKGARAIMIRSIGTHSHRLPHTGATGWGKTEPIPALAVSPPDADLIERVATRGKTIRVALTATPRILGTTKSANVIVDIPGHARPDEIVIVGGHLDSWDLGTGAVDDGAGVAITTAAVRLIQKLGVRPARTIRLVHWGAEEVGLLGAKAYAEKHKDEIAKHMIGSESDFGAQRIYRINSNVSDEGQQVVDTMLRVLAPLGVGRGLVGSAFQGSGGPDLSPLHPLGLPRVSLAQDGTDYFDLHHTPDDTFDKIEDAALRQNVAAYAVFLWIAANVETEFRPRALSPVTTSE